MMLPGSSASQQMQNGWDSVCLSGFLHQFQAFHCQQSSAQCSKGTRVFKIRVSWCEGVPVAGSGEIKCLQVCKILADVLFEGMPPSPTIVINQRGAVYCYQCFLIS